MPKQKKDLNSYKETKRKITPILSLRKKGKKWYLQMLREGVFLSLKKQTQLRLKSFLRPFLEKKRERKRDKGVEKNCKSNISVFVVAEKLGTAFVCIFFFDCANFFFPPTGVLNWLIGSIYLATEKVEK